jgi:outer membrane autotransporter protein
MYSRKRNGLERPWMGFALLLLCLHGFLATAADAQSTPLCGPLVAGSVTCDNGTYTGARNPPVTGPGIQWVNYEGVFTSDVQVNVGQINLAASGLPAIALRPLPGSTATATIFARDFGTIQTTQAFGNILVASENSSSHVIADVGGTGRVVSRASNTFGVTATVATPNSATTSLTARATTKVGGTVEIDIRGAQSHGAFAFKNCVGAPPCVSPTRVDTEVFVGDNVNISAWGFRNIGAFSLMLGDFAKGDASVSLSGNAAVRTVGDESNGIEARIHGKSATGTATALMNGGSIITNGLNSYGVLAENRGPTSAATATVTGGTILTQGEDSAGVLAQIAGFVLNLPERYNPKNPDGSPVTNADGSLFMVNRTVRQANDSTAPASAQIGGATTVTTLGKASDAVRVATVGSGALSVDSAGHLAASGQDASGIRVNTPGGQGYTVRVTGGSVTGGTGSGAGIRAVADSAATGAIEVGTALIDGTASGRAIVAQGAGSKRISAGPGADIRGGIEMTGGDNRLELNGTDLSRIPYLRSDHIASPQTTPSATVVLSGIGGTVNGSTLEGWRSLELTGAAPVAMQGRLTLGRAGDADGGLLVAPGATLIAAGQGQPLTVDGQVVNSGTVRLPGPDSARGMVINGAFRNQGDVVLSADLSQGTSNALTVTGAITGLTRLRIANTAGTAMAAAVERLRPLFMNGDFPAAVIELYQEGKGLMPFDLIHEPGGAFVPVPKAAVGTYEAMNAALPQVAMETLAPVRTRFAGALSRQTARLSTKNAPADAAAGAAAPTGTPVWADLNATRNEVTLGQSQTGSSYTQNIGTFNGGGTFVLNTTERGTLYGGLSLSALTATTDTMSEGGTGTLDTKGYSFGTSLTYLSDSSLFVDAQVQRLFLTTDITSVPNLTGLPDVVDDVGSDGYAVSVEVGRSFATSDTLTLTPMFQVRQSSVTTDAFTDGTGLVVPEQTQDLTQARLGLLASLDTGDARWTAGFGLTRTFGDALDFDVGGVTFTSEQPPLAIDVGLGVSYALNDFTVLSASASFNQGMDNIDYSQTQMQVGLTIRF